MKNKRMAGIWRMLAAIVVGLGLATASRAEDIDIFMANTAGGSSVNPNIMLFVDNSANWSRSSQKWPDNNNVQGAAEMAAIANVLTANTIPANIGLAGFDGTGSNVGGYIRFSARDMGTSANKTALTGIANYIGANTTSSSEKVNSNNETIAMYEVYKYFKGRPVYTGAYSSGGPASNVDIANNPPNTTSANPKTTAAAFGLTSGFAYDTTSMNYLSPGQGANCGKNYLVMVMNNVQGQLPTGQQTYETTNAGSYLSPPPGVNSTTWTSTWARYLYQNGISVYILDAYYAQQNVAYSQVLAQAALVGGGKYFAVKNQNDIELAIKQILAEINAANSTFASASLPISATNRSQDLNEVFIGMFRPDDQAAPRWRGNLKRYQLQRSTTGVNLVDTLGTNAINTQTGFVYECAASFFTTDSGSYWQATKNNNITGSLCTNFPTVGGVTGSKWSDLPDGATVEKGGVAEVIRKGNNPPGTNSTPTWNASGRNVLTYSASTPSKLTALTTTATGWSPTLLSWVQGMDDNTAVTSGGVTSYSYSEFTDTTSTSSRTRPSIHGDVIHSRPLPVNYSANGVTVYYGANDGMLRAVDASTGRERWAYVAPEHYAKFQRLHDNSPLVNYPNVSPTLNPQPKDFFFDGSIGLYQNSDNSQVWIFPAQRRGGRMLYAFDVTDPNNPLLKWRVGCPNLTDDTNCTSADFTPMGQTWSTPAVAFLKGVSATTPVLIVGAGYDGCEDADVSMPGCTSSRKGAGVYVLDAGTGAKLAFFPTGGSVVADIALSDANNDGSVDFAYAATTTGEIYRIDFSDVTYVPQASSGWKMRKVAVTTGGSRKFLFTPALLRAGTKMYIALGSGDREHPLSTDYPVTAPVTNRFYVYLDDLSVPASSMTATPINLDVDLQNYSNGATQTCNAPGVTPVSGLKGWFMDLLRTDPSTNQLLVGEQTISSALIAAGMVTFNTNRAITAQANVCANPLGEARGYWVNLLNASGAIGVGSATCGGDRSVAFIGGGLTPSPTLATVVIDGKTTTVAIGAAQRSGGASSSIAPQQVKPGISSRRRSVYWKSNAVD